ncbi:Uncharacterized protein DBV15_01647, partial [Temnothorax longispinosus]
DIPTDDVTSLTGTTPKTRRIYTRQPDRTRGLICSRVIPVDATRAFTASDHENCSEGHNSFAVLHTCSQLTGGEWWDRGRETRGDGGGG